jgi:hypothetical protein
MAALPGLQDRFRKGGGSGEKLGFLECVKFIKSRKFKKGWLNYYAKNR